MNLLAIETSSGACSAAILTDSGGVRILSQHYQEMQRGHAESIIGMIRDTVAEACLDFGNLNRIAVSIGPGSFTGTRVGIAAGRGLALSLDAEIVGVSALAILSEKTRQKFEGPIVATLQAGRSEIYFEIFDADGRSLAAPMVTSADMAVERLPEGPVVLCGSGSSEIVSAAPGRDLILSDVRWPDAETLARLAYRMPAATVPPTPLYIRAADAKIQTAGVVSRLPTPSS